MHGGTKAAVDRFYELYPKLHLNEQSVNTWETKVIKNKGST